MSNAVAMPQQYVLPSTDPAVLGQSDQSSSSLGMRISQVLGPGTIPIHQLYSRRSSNKAIIELAMRQ
jgi:hypothetical protein